VKAEATKSKWLYLAAFCALAAQALCAAEPPDCRPASKAAMRTIAKGRVVAQISASTKDDDIVVHLDLTNRGKAPYRISAWDLPTGGGETEYKNLFWVYRNSKPVQGRGLMTDAESENDFITLCPRCTCTANIGLSEHYDVDSKGLYRIQYMTSSGPGHADWIDSNVIEVEKK